MTERITAPHPHEAGAVDVARAWGRPAAAGALTVGAAALASWWHPWAGVAVLGAAGALSWRLHGTVLSPWRPQHRDPFPIAARSPRARAAAAGLRWRWEDACVNAGLGRWSHDAYGYEGLTLVGASEHADGVIAHARPTGEHGRDDVVRLSPALAAGLEAASTRVLGGDDDTIAILVVPPAQADGWT